MNYEAFFKVSYEYFDYFVYMSILLFAVLYLFSHRLSINGLLDPFTFTYTFTYSTSYSVIILLYIFGHISDHTFSIFSFYGFLFLISINIFSRISYAPGDYKFFSIFCFDKKKAFLFSIIFVYLLLVAFTIKTKGFSLFTETNRFEDNRGLGPIVRILEMCTFTIICIISIYLYRLRFNMFKKVLLYAIFIAFMIFNAIISGAKADLLFYIFAALVSVKIFNPNFSVSIKNMVMIIFLSLTFVFVVLFYNFSSSINMNLEYGEIFELLFRRLTDRILSNGDMYYMGLPNDVYEGISVNNILVVMLAPILSYSFMSKLAGYDIGQFEIGKQLLLAHYSGNTIAGGPTDHFDFFALLYFGVIGGAIFIVLLALLLCFLRKMTVYGRGDIISSALVTVFWMKSLSWLLKPGLFLGTILYFTVFLLLIRAICYLLCINQRSAF